MGRRRIEIEPPMFVGTDVPFERCIDCAYWRPLSKGNGSEIVDYSTGNCERYGYTKVPPMYSCKGWELVNGDLENK